MANFLFLCFLFFLSSSPQKSLPFQKCPPTSFPGNGSHPPVTVKFPFFAGAGDKLRRCVYPGFHLTSDGKTPFISLPPSGHFSVLQIDYSEQTISVSDPNNCLPNRILTLDLTNSPFSGATTTTFTQEKPANAGSGASGRGTLNYTFFNCSAGGELARVRGSVAVACLSGRNFTVYMVAGESPAAKNVLSEREECRPIKSVSAPTMTSRSNIVTRFDPGSASMKLSWREPNCHRCYGYGPYYNNGNDDEICGFKTQSGLETGCSHDAMYDLEMLVIKILVCVLVVLILATMIKSCIRWCCAGKPIPENNDLSHSATP